MFHTEEQYAHLNKSFKFGFLIVSLIVISSLLFQVAAAEEGSLSLSILSLNTKCTEPGTKQLSYHTVNLQRDAKSK